ncbi:MAG: carboxypeptidase-like regulatory protein, partial [Mucilaginibacter sp.]|nr:carboxypeptidase-like regulatory protein [Mucilaginibacter sp.]
NAKVSYIRTIDDFHSLTVTPAVRYGFSNKIFSANMGFEYKNDPFHNAKFYADFGSDVLDLNNVGTRSLYFNTLSTLLSENNYVKYYRSHYGDVGYQREVLNGVFLKGGFSYSSRSQLYNTSFSKIKDNKDRQFTSNNPLAPPGTPADDHSFLFPDNQALVFNASATFTFDQRYETRPTGKFNLPSKYPTLTVNYRKGFKSVLGSDVDYDFASVDISQDHIRVGLTGYSSFKLSGGGFFNNNTLYYMDYNHFLGNQGTTFDPTYVGSFHFLPFYTYSTNGAFLEAHYQHNFAGSIFNHIPLLRKWKLEEIIGANYLTTKNNRNFREFYVGIQRLIFRVDYGISYAGDKKYIQGFRIFYGIR